MKSLAHIALAILCLAGAAHTAVAHTSGASFLSVRALTDTNFSVSLDLDVNDLHELLQLDTDANDALTWREIDSASASIESLAFTHTTFAGNADPCEVRSRSPLAIAEHGTGPFVRVSATLRCAAGTFNVDHSAWFAFDPGHRALLDYADIDGKRVSTLLSKTSPTWRTGEATAHRLRRFLAEGAVHLITGYDHLAFLAVLLLALLRRPRHGDAQPLRSVLHGAFVVITSFTVAHSVTLGLAATGLATLPGKPVEITIAASVLIAAVLNLWRGASAHGWKLAFGFGLVHGLGFAGALAEMTGEKIDVLALAAFNVGIEAAQLAVAAITVPLLWFLFRPARVERFGVPAASLAMAAMAAFWMISRMHGTA
jgi:hypothetical protein